MLPQESCLLTNYLTGKGANDNGTPQTFRFAQEWKAAGASLWNKVLQKPYLKLNAPVIFFLSAK